VSTVGPATSRPVEREAEAGHSGALARKGFAYDRDLLAAGVPVDDGDEVQAVDPKTLKCGIVCRSWRVVVEFDGDRFHKLLGSQ
jgi:hypothetical protein